MTTFFFRSKLFLSVVRTKREPLQLASIFRLLLLLRLRPRDDTIITIITTITGITGTMMYLRHVPDNTIIHRTLVDPATVLSLTVGLPWNRPVIVCWTRHTGIIIVQLRKRRSTPHNPLLGSTVAAPWRLDVTRAELSKA